MQIKIDGKTYKNYKEASALLTPQIDAFLDNWFDNTTTITAYTSGSTGAPKEIKLNKCDMQASAVVTNAHFNINTDSTLLLSLSANYIAGMMMIVRWLTAGCNLISVPPTQNPLQNITTPITFAAFVPMQIEAILSDPQTAAKLNSVDTIIIGGAPLNSATELKLKNYKTSVFATYGMTETLSHVAVRCISQPNDYYQSNDYYQAVGKTTFATDSRSCLVITTPHLLQQTFITNDIVELIDNKQFRWVGRYDNVINSGGVKISPEEIENLLANQISARFYISKLPDALLGEKMILVIEGEPLSATNELILLRYCNENLPKYKSPKEIIYIPMFAETLTGKVKREINL